MKGLAERNKMTIEQFHQHLQGSGVEPSTMRERFRAQFAWREVIRRRASMSVSITQRDVDRVLSDHGERGRRGHRRVAGAEDHPADAGQARSGRAGAAPRRGRRACGRSSAAARPWPDLARAAADVRYEDLKYIKPSSIREPTRSLLLSAKDGDLLPPSTAAHGVEVYAVCGRRPIKADEKQREKAEGELAQREFEIVAKRHLRDLRQDAHIEYR